MITRYAIFQGQLRHGQEAAMRAFVDDHLTPLWRKFAEAQEVRVLFGVEQDKNGPAIPLMLAITYADHAAMQRGISSPARHAAKAILPQLYDRFFQEVHLFHYVMDRQRYTD